MSVMLASPMKAMAVRLRFSLVLGEAVAAIDPGAGAFHDPASWDDLETLGLDGALDRLDPPGGIGHGPAQLLAAIGAVSEDRLQEWKQMVWC